MMKAVVCTKYGPPELLQIHEISKPVLKNNEVLIKIHSTTVASGDCVIRAALHPFVRFVLGLRSPRNPVLGTDLSGMVVEVGAGVTRFRKGDRVFASTGMKFGCHAEYIALNENKAISLIPENVTYDEATAIAFGGSAGLHFLRKARVTPGKSILIYGASGAVGSSAVQLAKHFGADVTGVCSSRNLDFVKSLGADVVLDYTAAAFKNDPKQYDIVFDAVGKTSSRHWYGFLTLQGVFVTVAKGLVNEKAQDLDFLRELIVTGALRAVIDRSYPLKDIVEAYRYVETGKKRGNVVIQVIKNLD